jgi:hypothetical protein
MYTINKDDMNKFIDIMYPKGHRSCHIYDIYVDLISVYDDTIEYSIDDLLLPFTVYIPEEMKKNPLPEGSSVADANLKFVYDDKVIAGGKFIKYKDYLDMLFYISYSIKFSDNIKVCVDVSGKIVNDSPLGGFDGDEWNKLYVEWYGENYKDWRYRWHTDMRSKTPHHFTLTDKEHEESDMLYERYLIIKQYNRDIDDSNM